MISLNVIIVFEKWTNKWVSMKIIVQAMVILSEVDRFFM